MGKKERDMQRELIARIIDPKAFDARHPHQLNQRNAFKKADEILKKILR